MRGVTEAGLLPDDEDGQRTAAQQGGSVDQPGFGQQFGEAAAVQPPDLAAGAVGRQAEFQRQVGQVHRTGMALSHEVGDAGGTVRLGIAGAA